MATPKEKVVKKQEEFVTPVTCYGKRVGKGR